MTLIDIVDDEDRVIGQKERDAAHRDGDLHRVAHVWIVNSKKELLCHRRADCKRVFPGFWDIIIGGHLDAGESYEAAALREVEEEVGLVLSKDDLVLIGKWKGAPNETEPRIREFSTSYAAFYGGDPGALKADPGEISELKFMPIEELRAIARDPERSKGFITFKTFDVFIGKLERIAEGFASS